MNAARARQAALAGVVILLGAAPAIAQELCSSTVNGEAIAIDPAAQGVESGGGVRERLLAWPGRKLSSITGRAPACDSETLIAYLSRSVPPDEIDGYCLSEQENTGFVLVPGERNFRGRCTSTTCEKVNTTTEGAVNIAGTIATGVVNKTLGIDDTKQEAPEDAQPKGLVHSSGAAILTGTTGYLTANLGTIGTGLTTALSSPAILAASAVTVVAVGGAVYLCRD